ncbi:MAG TPA: tRNA-uridine aminocarboxypropyltransferase, partial [Polyangiaceae bacterium]|nr:tRNA-uridine aminocarboxypropyltransferase [Polyangiaceae bacterium]
MSPVDGPTVPMRQGAATMRGRMAPRCAACGLLQPLCLCALREPLALGTQVVSVVHVLEARKSTTTSRLLPLALTQAECRIRGERDAPPFDAASLVTESHRTWLLFPAEEARELDDALLAEEPRPVRLVVPDGTWSQGAKLARRVREAAGDQVTCVKLSQTAPSRYRLRRTERTDGLCTYEAVVEALAR